MKKLIILSSLFGGIITTTQGQINTMYNSIYQGQFSNVAMNKLDKKLSVDFVHMNVNQVGSANNQSVLSARGLYKNMNYGIKAASQSYAGIDQMDVQLNVARAYQINENSKVAFGVNVSYFKRQMEAANAQTETDLGIREMLDYDNVYAGFAAAYSYKDLNVGISSGDLFNTSLDQSASWTLQADFTVDVLDSVIVLKPNVMAVTGYDLDKPVAMLGLDAILNQFVTTSMGYYTNESVHLGMGLMYNRFKFDYRYRYYFSEFREITTGQNVVGLSYQF